MESVLRDTMNQQCQEGMKVSAVVHSTERRLTDQAETTTLGYRIIRAARWFTINFAPIAPTFAWSVHKEISQLKPDALHIHMPNLSAFWLLVLPSARALSWKIHWHSDVVASQYRAGLRFFYRFYQPFEHLMLRKAQHIAVSSPPYLEHSIPLQRFRHKCLIEPIHIDRQRIMAAAKSVHRLDRNPSEGLRVLCVGRLTYYKDFGTAIRAIAELPEATLHIAGSGAERESLTAIINSLEVSDRVTLLGEVSEAELWKQYRWCDVLCLPSVERTEAFGVVILEAAVFGKPSIVADTQGSGMGWAIHQVTPRGLMFKAGDARDLAGKLARISEI